MRSLIRYVHRCFAATALAALMLATSAGAGTPAGNALSRVYSYSTDGGPPLGLDTVREPLLLSPDGRRIAFRLESGWWIASADGSGARFLTTHQSETPAWSPDGRNILYGWWVLDRYGGHPTSEWYIADADGSNPRRLNEVGQYEYFSEHPGFGPSSPFWSADGTRIGVEVGNWEGCRPGYTKCVVWYTLIFDRQGRRLGPAVGTDAKWSPDGRYYAAITGVFVVHEHPSDFGIAIVGPGSPAPGSSIDKRPGWCWDGVSWSPDGSRVLLVEIGCAGRQAGRGPRLHLVRARDRRTLAVLTGCCARWTRDGSHLLYLATSRGTQTSTAVTRDGKRPRKIGSPSLWARWSPVASRIAYVRQIARGRLELVTARWDGTHVRRVASGPWQSARVHSWSRDGKLLAFTTRRAQRAMLAVVAPSGGRARPLRRDSTRARWKVVGWTADSQRLIVVVDCESGPRPCR